MRSRIIFIIIALTSYSISQDEIGIPKLKPVDDYWSIGYYAAGNLGLSNGYVSENAVQAGYGGMFEIAYKDSKINALIIIGENQIATNNENSYIEVVEFSMGPRFSFTKSSSDFAEITFGTLVTRKITRNFITTFEHSIYPAYSSDPKAGFVLTGALGKILRINRFTNIVMKLRLINAFSIQNDWFTFLNMSAGIVFNSKKVKRTEKNNASEHFGIVLTAGGNNADLVSKVDYDWGPSYGIESFYNLTPKIELLLALSTNKIKGINTASNYNESCFSIVFGGRLYVNESNNSAFIEIGGGSYSHHFHASSLGVGQEYYDRAMIYPGFTIGTGVKIKFINFLGLIAKSNLHFLFTEKYSYAPNYLTLQGGLRFNL